MIQVGRWFGLLTDQLLRRGVHRALPHWRTTSGAWITAWNGDPKPFAWTKAAKKILNSLARHIARIPGAGHGSLVRFLLLDFGDLGPQLRLGGLQLLRTRCAAPPTRSAARPAFRRAQRWTA